MHALHISHHIYSVRRILHSHHTDYYVWLAFKIRVILKIICVYIAMKPNVWKEKCESEKQNSTTKIVQTRKQLYFLLICFFLLLPLSLFHSIPLSPFIWLAFALPILLFLWSLCLLLYTSWIPFHVAHSLHLRACCWLFFVVRMHLLTETIESYYKYHAAVHYRNMDTKIAPSEKHLRAYSFLRKKLQRRRDDDENDHVGMYFAEIKRTKWEQNHTASK